MPAAFLIDRNLQVGWGTSSFAISVWLWGQKMYLLLTGPWGGGSLAMLIKESAHWCVLGLLQAETELCQCSLQSCLPSPKANGRAPNHIGCTHQGSRSRLLMCKSMSWVSCPLRGWPLGWVLLAMSVSQVLHHSKHSCDGKGAQAGRHYRQEGLGVPFFLPYHKAISSLLGISCFLFFFC